MNKREIFKAAHEMARGTFKAVGNYMIAFKLALIAIYDHLENGPKVMAPVDRANRFRGRTFLPPVFDAPRIEKYIKEHSRIVREFTTLAAYNEAAATGKVGACWSRGGERVFYAYEYFN